MICNSNQFEDLANLECHYLSRHHRLDRNQFCSSMDALPLRLLKATTHLKKPD